MTEHEALHICRNPYGHPQHKLREACLTVCDRLESWKGAYLNMRQFAEDSGLDTVCYHGPRVSDGNRELTNG